MEKHKEAASFCRVQELGFAGVENPLKRNTDGLGYRTLSKGLWLHNLGVGATGKHFLSIAESSRLSTLAL